MCHDMPQSSYARGWGKVGNKLEKWSGARQWQPLLFWETWIDGHLWWIVRLGERAALEHGVCTIASYRMSTESVL